MSKQDWVSGEIFTRNKVNQPFFMQSGTVSGGNVILQIGPGRVRFPFKNLALVEDGAQAFTLNSPTVSGLYTLFLGSDGTILASGHATFADMPSPPRGDSEYLGTVFTGPTLTTAALVGPWNAPAGSDYEQRGEYVAATAARPRFVTSGAPLASTGDITPISAPLPGVQGGGPSSRLGGVTVYEPAGTRSMIHATVTWMPSGAINPSFVNPFMPSGVLKVAIQMAVERAGAASSDPAEYFVLDSREYSLGQDPDGASNPKALERSIHTLSFSVPSSKDSVGEQVTYDINVARSGLFSTSTGVSHHRIKNFNLTVIPGYRAKVSSLP